MSIYKVGSANYQKQRRDGISDDYVRALIRQGIQNRQHRDALRASMIPKEMVKAYAELLKLKRFLKELQ